MVILQNPDHGFCTGFAPPIAKECQGSRVVSYSATPERDELSLDSISAMPHYQDRSHELLRLEDYEQQGKGYSFPIHNLGNAFQQSNSLFGPCTSPVTSSQSMGFLPIQNLGNHSGTFGTETAAPVSDSSVKPPFGSTSSGFGVGFNYVSPFAPSRASNGFGASPFGVSSVSVPEGPSIPAFKVPTTHEFGVTSTPLYWCSYGNQTSSGSQGTTSSVSVPEGPSIPAFKVPTTHEFGVTSTPLYWCSYGNQTSSGSQGTTSTTHQGAIPSYQDKSHEELRSEDYGLHNKGYSFPIQNQGNAFQQSNSLFGPCTSPVTSSQSMGFFPIQNLGNLSGTFGTETAAPVSDSSVKPPFGSTSTNMFSFPKNSGVGFFNDGSPFAPSRASSDFGASPFVVSSVSVPERPSIPAFKVPTTHESTPLYWCSFGNEASSGGKFSSSCLETSGAPSNIFRSEPLSNQSSNYSPCSSFKSSFFGPNRENFITPSNTISTGSKLFPSVNPFCSTDVKLSQSKAVTPQPTTAYFMSTCTPNLNSPSLLIPFTDPRLQNTRECPNISPTFTQGASVGTFSWTKPSVTVSPFTQPTSVTASDPWLSIVKSSQPQQNSGNTGSLSTNDLIKPSQWKGDKVDENSSPFQLNENSTRSAHTATQHEDRSAKLNHHQGDVAAGTESRADHVLALLPKLPDDGYYTEPSLHKLAAKEMEEPGFCSHVNEFVVGRQGYGSIKFLGETDVRHLDIKSIVHFSNREVIVYPDGRNKPGVGQELHKAGEVTVLNVKCINKNTGQQYVEGHLVESYKDLLIKTTIEHGAEFVSFNPVAGEWKFRVPHF